VGGTYSGNALGCAAGLAVLDILESEDLFTRANVLGDKIRTRFEAFKETFSIVGDVRGLSGMMAMELVLDKETKAPAPELANALKTFCFEKGLMLLATGTYGNVIRILSPLVITDDQLEQGLNIMEQGFAAIGK
jgi:4-aminobutyrate aminotransferase/(S)-3-amino-2-methylpropionate transaminase